MSIRIRSLGIPAPALGLLLALLMMLPAASGAVPPTGVAEVDALREEYGVLPLEGGPTTFASVWVERAGDLDGVPGEEALVVSHAFAQEGGLNAARIDALDARGDLRWSRGYPQSWMAATFAVGDVTGDGAADVAVQAAHGTTTLSGGFLCVGVVVVGTCGVHSTRAETLHVELLDGASGLPLWSREAPAFAAVGESGAAVFDVFFWLVAGGYANTLAADAIQPLEGARPGLLWVTEANAGPEGATLRVAGIHALDALTGEPRWAHEAVSFAERPFVLAIPDATGDGNAEVLVETPQLEGSLVSVLDGATGVPLWALPAARAQSWDVLPLSSSTLLAGRGDAVQVVDAATGEVRAEASRAVWTRPTVVSTGALTHVVLADSESALSLRTLALPDLVEAWTLTIEPSPETSPQWHLAVSADGTPDARLLATAAAWDEWGGRSRFFAVDPLSGGLLGEHEAAGVALAWRGADDADLRGAGDAYALLDVWGERSLALVSGLDGSVVWTRPLAWGQGFARLGGDGLLIHPEGAWPDPAAPLALDVIEAERGSERARVELAPLEPWGHDRLTPPRLWDVLLQVPSTCERALDVIACAYAHDLGTFRTVGIFVAMADGTWTQVHVDEIDTFSGIAYHVAAEAFFDGRWYFVSSGVADDGPDNVPDAACVGCVSVVDEHGFVYVQRAAVDGTGAEVVLGARHEGSLRGLHAGVYRGEPFARVSV